MGKARKRKAHKKRGGAGAGRPSSPQFPPVVSFLSALSQFCGPDYLGAWNRLVVLRRGVG